MPSNRETEIFTNARTEAVKRYQGADFDTAICPAWVENERQLTTAVRGSDAYTRALAVRDALKATAPEDLRNNIVGYARRWLQTALVPS